MTDLQSYLVQEKACRPAIIWVGKKSFKQAWDTCINENWLVWLLVRFADKRDVLKMCLRVAKPCLSVVKDKRTTECFEIMEKFANYDRSISNKMFKEARRHMFSSTAFCQNPYVRDALLSMHFAGEMKLLPALHHMYKANPTIKKHHPSHVVKVISKPYVTFY